MIGNTHIKNRVHDDSLWKGTVHQN